MFSAHEVQALPERWSAYFDTCHFILSALAVRKEVGRPFSRTNPLATWLATILACFAGSLITNPLLGKPILGALSLELNLYLASLVWWGIFYSPGDILFTVLNNQIVMIPVCVAKEIYRVKKILGGIEEAGRLYPNHELIQITIGVLKGNGSGFIKPLTRLVCGTWTPGSSEVLKMSVTSKSCLVGAVLLAADSAGQMPGLLSGDVLYLGIVGGCVLIKLADLLGQPIDPYSPLEDGISLLTGGLWDRRVGVKTD